MSDQLDHIQSLVSETNDLFQSMAIQRDAWRSLAVELLLKHDPDHLEQILRDRGLWEGVTVLSPQPDMPCLLMAVQDVP